MKQLKISDTPSWLHMEARKMYLRHLRYEQKTDRICKAITWFAVLCFVAFFGGLIIVGLWNDFHQ